MSSTSSLESRQKGFTLTEVLIVIVVISVIAAFLYPVFQKARENARCTACLSNMKQINLAIKMYVQDNDRTWPARTVCRNIYAAGAPYHSWAFAIQPFIKATSTWKCPDDPTPTAFNGGDFNPSNDIAKSYAVVEQFHDQNKPGNGGYTAIMSLGDAGNHVENLHITEALIPEPARTIWLVESGIRYNSDGTCYGGTPCQDAANDESRNNPSFFVGNRQKWLTSAQDENNVIAQNHNGGANWGYGDGHVKWAHLDQLINTNDSSQDAFIRLKAQGY